MPSTETAPSPSGTAPRAAPQGAQRLLLFAASGGVYGFDIAAVREIVPVRRATRLPGAPEHVSGLINLRGSIVTVIDLPARLSGAAVSDDGSIIVAEIGSRVVGLAVDDVRDVQPLAPERFEPAAGDLARGGIVRGLGHFDDGVVIVLDVGTLVRQVLA